MIDVLHKCCTVQVNVLATRVSVQFGNTWHTVCSAT